MKIGQLAKVTGVTSATIRFYEQKGLMPFAKRGSNSYRIYNEEDVLRVQLIKYCQHLGFSLSQLPSLLMPESIEHEQVMAALDEKVAEVEALQQQLSNKKQQLTLLQSTLTQSWQKGECLNDQQIKQLLNNLNSV